MKAQYKITLEKTDYARVMEALGVAAARPEMEPVAQELRALRDRLFREVRIEYVAEHKRCPECGDDQWTPGTVCEFCAAHGFDNREVSHG